MKKKDWLEFQQSIVNCKKCPRLRKHCEKIANEKRKSYVDWDYWGRPVPDFGDHRARVVVLGLAPAAHGANRTGRMFTGDRSGDWLYRALHKAGFANQSEAISINDGLRLKNCLITATCHCAPPQNKPTSGEIKNCENYLQTVLDELPVKVVLALGGIAWKAALDHAKVQGWFQGARPRFSHGEEFEFENGVQLIGSYHPSQQNTFTKRLTEPMFDKVFRRIHQILSADK